MQRDCFGFSHDIDRSAHLRETDVFRRHAWLVVKIGVEVPKGKGYREAWFEIAGARDLVDFLV